MVLYLLLYLYLLLSLNNLLHRRLLLLYYKFRLEHIEILPNWKKNLLLNLLYLLLNLLLIYLYNLG